MAFESTVQQSYTQTPIRSIHLSTGDRPNIQIIEPGRVQPRFPTYIWNGRTRHTRCAPIPRQIHGSGFSIVARAQGSPSITLMDIISLFLGTCINSRGLGLASTQNYLVNVFALVRIRVWGRRSVSVIAVQNFVKPLCWNIIGDWYTETSLLRD